MAELRVPRVDEEVQLSAREKVQLECLIPVEHEVAGADDRARLVHVVTLEHAVEVAEVRLAAGRTEAASGEELYLQQARETGLRGRGGRPAPAVPQELCGGERCGLSDVSCKTGVV